MLTKTAVSLLKEAGLGIGAGLALYNGGIGARTGYARAKELTESEGNLLRNAYGLESEDNLKWRNARRGLIGGLVGSLPGAMLVSSKSAGPIARALGVVGAMGGGALGSRIMSGKFSRNGAEFVQDMRDNVLPEQIEALDIPLNAKRALARYYDYDPEKMK